MREAARPPSFGAFASEWLATSAAVRLKQSALCEYEGVVRLHLAPRFGDLSIDAVTVERVQTFIAASLAAGVAARTVCNRVIVLKAILATAVDYGLLAENSADKVAMPRIERSETAFLTPAQLRQLIAATPPAWALLLALPAMAGLRVGECRALLWSDLDTEAMTVSVTKSMRGGVVTSPKNPGSVALVPVPEALRPYIEQRRNRAEDHALMFSKADGRPVADSTPGRILARSLSAAGLPHIRFHDLRGSWTVAHLKAGTDLKTLARLGRWSSEQTLLSRYAHVIGIGGDAVKRFDELFRDELS